MYTWELQIDLVADGDIRSVDIYKLEEHHGINPNCHSKLSTDVP